MILVRSDVLSITRETNIDLVKKALTIIALEKKPVVSLDHLYGNQILIRSSRILSSSHLDSVFPSSSWPLPSNNKLAASNPSCY